MAGRYSETDERRVSDAPRRRTGSCEGNGRIDSLTRLANSEVACAAFNAYPFVS